MFLFIEQITEISLYCCFFFQVNGSKFNNGFHEKFSSMGIYVMNRNVMIKLLNESFPKANDLKNEVIPGAISLGLKVWLS